MTKYKVEITKVFGLAVTNTVTVEAEDVDKAIDEAKNTDWKPIYDSITPSNMSQSYDIAEILVDGKVQEVWFFSDPLIREAVELNTDTRKRTGLTS